MAPFLYKTDEAPRYLRGHAVSLSMVAMAAILYALMSVYFIQRNRLRRDGKEGGASVIENTGGNRRAW